jgi:hypothetical protein
MILCWLSCGIERTRELKPKGFQWQHSDSDRPVRLFYAALAKAREQQFAPLAVAVLDAPDTIDFT